MFALLFKITAVFVICIICTEGSVPNNYILSIKANSNTKKLSHFWRSTGFCPPEPRSNISKYLSTQDVKINIALISALPNRSITQIRVHWLLDLITYSRDLSKYNFTNLDYFLDWLHLHNLRPGFELMGNPSSFFSNFLDEKQNELWQILVRNIVLRYAERYGAKYVKNWRFETWNEPDLKGYNTLNFTLKNYLSYVNATSRGLKAADVQVWPPQSDKEQAHFKLGGPAGLFKSPVKHPLCWGLLSQCARSLDCPLSFISFHKKGDGTSALVLDRGLELVQYIRKMFPSLATISVSNDEADILTGWSKNITWRADVRYAAMVVKVIIDHYNEFFNKRNIKIEVLSNDNAFLNYHPYYFTQRTLLTRFQMNNTHPPHIQFVKKPVYIVMGMLSFLGTRVYNNCGNSENIACLATETNEKGLEYVIILTYVNNSVESNVAKMFEVSVNSLPKEEYVYVIYLINNQKTNPFKVWEGFGSPVFPNTTVRDAMRAVEGPLRLEPPTTLLQNATIIPTIKFQSTLPTVALIHLCSKSENLPGVVTRVQIYTIVANEVLIIWSNHKGKTKCIKTYEIEFCPESNKSKIYSRINPNDTVFLSYQFVAKETTKGWYKIRAVDYWNRSGPYSAIKKFT